MMETVVSLKNISKQYWLSFGKQSLIGSFLAMFQAKKGIKSKKEICALKDIELCIKKGEAVGIIGENASGKTTILRIISKITVPTSGQLRVDGKVAGLLDLGAGFHGELTGRENIYLDAALYGMSRREIDDVYEKIVEFSGLGDFVNAQVKTYSQGMLVRLGFAIAIHVDPDIFLIDDSLAVGDEEFQRKCLSKVFELKEQGKTIIVVSHDLDSISRICERGILLKSGKIIKDGSMHKVIMRYVEAVGDKKAIACIDLKKLSIIFNNGKVIILWDGKPLTKHFGGYIGLQIKDTWTMSWHAQWRVIENSAYGWSVEGILNKYGLRLIFECKAQNERTLDFQISCELKRRIDLRRAGFGFMLSERYDSFMREANIEQIADSDRTQQEWTDVYRSDESGAPLVLISSEDLPILKLNFRQDKYAGFNLIQNTNQELNARVMQIQMSLPDEFNSDTDGKSLIKCTAELKLLDNEAFEMFIHEREETSSIRSGDMKVQVKNKDIRVFYKNIEITISQNLKFGFFNNKKFINLFEGEWMLQKKSASSLFIFSEFKDLGQKYKVFIELEPNRIKWKIEIKQDKSNKNESLAMQAYFTDRYVKHFDIEGEKGFCSHTEHAEIVTDFRCQGECVGLSTDTGELPAIVLETGKQSCLKLQNSDSEANARIIIHEAFKQNKMNGEIVLFENIEAKNKFISDKQNEYGLNSLRLKDNLRLEFGANRVGIYQNEQELTQGEGLCSGIFFNGRWHESKQLSKEFKREGEALKVIIRRKIPEVNELWNITYDEGVLRWSVELEASKSIAGLVCKAGVKLRPDFVKWTHSFKTGEFQNKNSECVVDLDDKNNTLLGVKSAGVDLPALFFQRITTQEPEGVIIKNSNEGCCLEFKFKGAKEINDSNRQSVFQGEIMLTENDAWENKIKRHRQQNFSLIGDNKFQLLICPQEIEMFYGDRKLTKKDGLRISLITEHGDLDSYYGKWFLEKTQDEKIEVRLAWANLPIEQRWLFEKEGNAILWRVILVAKQRVLLKDMFVHIFANFYFNRWLTAENKGEINFEGSKNNTISIFDNRSDLIGLYHDQISVMTPVLLLKPQVDMDQWILHICRYHKEEVIACGGRYIVGPKGKAFAIGEHEIFKAKLLLEDTYGSVNKSVKATGEIKAGKLALRIQKAKIRLFWEGKELTSALGLHTGFFKDDVWIDSTLAGWKIDISTREVCITLHWSESTVFQKWQLQIINEHEILWQVDTDIGKEKARLFKASLMLDNSYDSYLRQDKTSERFPLKFKNDHWEELISQRQPIEVRATANSLPDIIFDGTDKKGNLINILENSDVLHSARVLKCETAVAVNEKVNSYLFSSKIRIAFRE